VNLVDEVLQADQAELPQPPLHDRVVRQRRPPPPRPAGAAAGPALARPATGRGGGGGGGEDGGGRRGAGAAPLADEVADGLPSGWKPGVNQG
jgi:hypothetical protein